MDDLEALVEGARNAVGAIGADLAVIGGILRCNSCSAERPLGDAGHHTAHGWPECCGLTMTWVTPKLLAFEARQPSPAGHHLEAVPDTFGLRWQVDTTRRCRAMPGRRTCGRQSVASLLRGTVRQVWYGYCADHMYGRWVDTGVVMCWVLRLDE